MNWNSLDQFLSMGGHGLYVWGSYAFAAMAMLVEPLLAMQRHRRARRDAAEATDADSHDSFKE